LSGVGLAAIPPAEAIEDAVRAHCPTAVVQLQLGPVLDELQWLVTPGLLPRATQATRALHAAPDRRSAQLQACALLDTPGLTSSPGDLQRLRRLLEGTLPYLERPRAHWRHLRSDRLAREVRRAFKQHTCAIASPTDPALLEVLFLARLRWMAKTLWTKRYLAS
jgi:transposase-like protein